MDLTIAILFTLSEVLMKCSQLIRFLSAAFLGNQPNPQTHIFFFNFMEFSAIYQFRINPYLNLNLNLKI